MLSEIVVSGETDSQRTTTKLDTCLIDGVAWRIVVAFDMWGQRCQTVFDASSELDPLEWLGRMVEKGWLLPIEVFRESDGLVLYTEDQLQEMGQ